VSADHGFKASGQLQFCPTSQPRTRLQKKGKALSNAMRMGKRSLAGVAAGALALGMLTIASAPAANAGKSIKPKVTTNAATASVAPVRYSTTASVQDPVLGANFVFSAVGTPGTDDSTITSDDTVQVTLVSAPSATSRLWLAKTVGTTFPSGAGASDDTLTLTSPNQKSAVRVLAGSFSVANKTSTDDTQLSTTIAVNEGGTYTGNVKIYAGNKAGGAEAANLIQTTTFTFTTAGKPAAVVLSPTTASLTNSTASTQRVTVTVNDSTGAGTQISSVDSFAVASANTAIATASPSSMGPGDFDDSSYTTLGTGRFTISGVPASISGNTTVTVTPQGTLSSSGVTAQSVAVSVAGSGTTSPSTLSVTAPTTNIIDDTTLDDTLGYDVNAALVKSVTITGTGASASVPIQATLTFSGLTSVSAGGSTQSSGSTIIATSDATGKVSWTVSWTAGSAGAFLQLFTPASSSPTRAAKWVRVDLVDSAPDPFTTPRGSIVQKTGEATSIAVSLTDQFGNAYPGYGVVGQATGTTATGTASARVVTDANGLATVSVPAPSATYTGSATIAFAITTPGGGAATSDFTPATLTATYSATGAVSAIAVNSDVAAASDPSTAVPAITTVPLISIPSTATGKTGDDTSGASFALSTSTASGAASITPVTSFTVTTTPANASTVTVPTGVKVSNLPPTDLTTFASGSQSTTVPQGGRFYVWGTKTGTFDITITSGGATLTAKVRIANSSNDAYNIAITPASQSIAAGAFGTATVKVTDAFGNPVATTDDTGVVRITATGEVRLGGFAATQDVTTNAAGEASVTVVTGTVAGDGALAATPKSSNKATAWATGYVAPTGYTAPITSAAATVKVTSAPAVKSIAITGFRTTVSGKPGIEIDGVTTGLENGKTVIPYFRFPGETSYTEGSARPEITDGAFMWSRKTGKKFYAYVTSDDGAVQSNRVIIPAN